jgi:hypothetical protein
MKLLEAPTTASYTKYSPIMKTQGSKLKVITNLEN